MEHTEYYRPLLSHRVSLIAPVDGNRNLNNLKINFVPCLEDAKLGLTQISILMTFVTLIAGCLKSLNGEVDIGNLINEQCKKLSKIRNDIQCMKIFATNENGDKTRPSQEKDKQGGSSSRPKRSTKSDTGTGSRGTAKENGRHTEGK